MKNILVIALVLIASTFAHAEVFSCKVDGRVVFTDDRKNCGSEASSVELNLKEDKRVNYRYPERKYEDRSGAYSIFVESPESRKDKQKLDRAVDRLNKTLDLIFNKIPISSHSYLKDTDFYIMIGPKSKLGGEKNGLRYFPKSGDSKLLIGDRRWSRSIVIYNVENFLWFSDLWVKKV
ncbi:DUF4124 domain-containing protein [Microbulbifer variabilis]|uniref:DUF4124 domain-containing protein n=1 Tax=Microbulbifer variabilis TaxID=266805 RepID=UPI001CFF2159|nr:DUF4124 domain-containing protein [Microbulbifer variabilis]